MTRPALAAALRAYADDLTLVEPLLAPRPELSPAEGAALDVLLSDLLVDDHPAAECLARALADRLEA